MTQTIVARISQQNSQNDESDVEAGYGPSYAVATFRVSRDLDGQQAYMRVYLQVPHQGTEFFPPNERAKQAAARGHCEVEAIRAFHKQNSTITPALLGIKEDVQDQQGVIPGGYAIHFVFQRVPGYPGWVPFYPSATKLIWDPIASKLYFVDFRDVHEAGSHDEDVVPDGNDTLEPKEMAPIVRWGIWGLAIPPDKRQELADISKWTL
ncbi:hypothetical protein CBS147333_7490 [Penicillium roqueforti]|nr:hypothetical protein CBS147333_7490 [Penicillium roqueforti]KAI3236593.1 hypothetical protein CBS147310_3562 [Penicillium roqueforti]KAI3275372.1 hypothetical protein CBS147308_1954 [Penicillium roqueforti]KAI3296379.1 hypothetical protein DTO003C3_1779 [Penicillium roqueforti]